MAFPCDSEEAKCLFDGLIGIAHNIKTDEAYLHHCLSKDYSITISNHTVLYILPQSDSLYFNFYSLLAEKKKEIGKEQKKITK